MLLLTIVVFVIQIALFGGLGFSVHGVSFKVVTLDDCFLKKMNDNGEGWAKFSCV